MVEKIPRAAQVMVTCTTLLSTKSTATVHFRSCISRLAQMVGWVPQINTYCKNEHQLFTKMNTICSFPYPTVQKCWEGNISFWDLWEWEIFEGGNRPFAGRIREIRQLFCGLERFNISFRSEHSARWPVYSGKLVKKILSSRYRLSGDPRVPQTCGKVVRHDVSKDPILWLHNQLRLSSELRPFEGKRHPFARDLKHLKLSPTRRGRGSFGRDFSVFLVSKWWYWALEFLTTSRLKFNLFTFRK